MPGFISILFQTAPPGSIYSKMYEKVTATASNLVRNIDFGIAQVQSENFALIADATELLMKQKDNCDMMLIDERFYKSGFGLAFPENWPYKKYFDKE
jgi:hypothetical protein